MSGPNEPKGKRIIPTARVKSVCPTPRDNFNVRSHMRGSGSRAPSVDGPEEQPVLNTVVGQRNINVFWEHLPWGDAQVFFERESYTASPAINNTVIIANYTIPRGMVLGITSVVFRAVLTVVAGAAAGGYVFARDDFFEATANNNPSGLFEPKLSNAMIVDKSWRDQTGATERSGYALLNTDIMTAGVPFMVFAKPSQTFTVDFTALQAMNAIVGTVGVHWQGVWIPVSLYESLRRKFSA